MSKIVSKEIECENFTINDVAEQLVEAIGTDKKVDAAFIVIRTEGKQAVIPMGDALKQLGLLSSGSIEEAVKEASEFVKNEISKRFNQFLDEIVDRHNSNEGGGSSVMDVKVLYSVNPGKFQEVAKNRTYEQFIAYLQEQPNFTIINLMSEAEKKALYTVAKLRI